MLAAIVDQRDRAFGLLDTVHQHHPQLAMFGSALHDADAIHAAAVAIVHRIRRPVGGNAWGDVQLVAFPMQAEQRFDDQAIHPAGRAGVPGPAATADVRRHRVHIRSDDVGKVAEAQSHLDLTAFFAQWLDGTGAPTFADKYSVYRLGNNKGFRTQGAITEDLDLFRMPVELRIETDGKTEDRRIDVSGTDSNYTVETFGRPRRISIDPENWLLKSTPDLAVRVAVLRGQQLVAQGDLTGALAEYQKALDSNKNSSLGAYRIGEVFFLQRNYQSAANSFRDALRGDDDPRWTEVWSHIHLGYIFDVTGQRDRAVNEYRLAVQTNDNTQGAINEARARMQAPYKRERADN